MDLKPLRGEVPRRPLTFEAFVFGVLAAIIIRCLWPE